MLTSVSTALASSHLDRLVETIRAPIIGDDRVLAGPYGPRRVTYADYTASGRSPARRGLHSKRGDAALREHAQRDLGYGLQATRFARTRAIIRGAVGADERDAVIFWGWGDGRDRQADRRHGSPHPGGPRSTLRILDSDPAVDRPVVFIGPYEHHSNELPWRESICEVSSSTKTPTDIRARAPRGGARPTSRSSAARR